VLNAFTTLAPVAHPATCSAPEVVLANSNPANRGRIGFVASIKGPTPSTTARVGTYRTSLAATASSTEPARPFGPARSTTAFISAEFGVGEVNTI